MTKTRTGISLPTKTIKELDRLAEEWFTNRSSAIFPIIQECQQLTQQPAPEAQKQMEDCN